MSRARRLVPLALLVSSGALAQQPDERARLDDFSLPVAAPSSRIEQLSPATAPIASSTEAVDRSIATPEKTADPTARPRQLSSADDRRSPDQLSRIDDTRGVETAAISSKADSTPGTVVRLRGKDRCDPQLDREQLAECLRILELRADEFNAPAPPQLSAEEKLLAEQRERDEQFADRSNAYRLRFATMTEPDADLQSNQVLASIYLDQPTGAPARPPEDEATAFPADVGEALKALGLDQVVPPQN